MNFTGKNSVHEEKDYEPGYESCDDGVRPITVNRIKEILKEMDIPYTSVKQTIDWRLNQYPQTKVLIGMHYDDVNKPMKPGLRSRLLEINNRFPTNYTIEIDIETGSSKSFFYYFRKIIDLFKK